MGFLSNSMSQLKYGKRLLPHVLDEWARTDPEHVFAVVPRTSNIADGFEEISMKSFARAVNATAYQVESFAGGQSTKFDTIAYLGPPGLGYFVMALGVCKAGYKTLLPSPRNSAEGLVSLLEGTECRHILTAPGVKVDQVLAQHPMKHSVIKPLDGLNSKTSVKDYPFAKSFEEAAYDPFVIIHTSGSTGHPKPITVRHGGLATVDAHRLMPNFEGCQSLVTRQTTDIERLFMGLPPFHVACIISALAIPLYYGQTIVWPSADQPLNADVVAEVLDNTSVDSCLIAPSILEDMSQSQFYLEKLAKLKDITFGGGPLTQRAGETVSRYTIVRNIIGSSEVEYPPIFDKEPEDWAFFHFDPRMKGVEFREVDSGLYELAFVRHHSTDLYHAVWYTFPNDQEYEPHDLFSKHPSKPNLWRYEGRADDLIVFSNGEKFNPGGMEETLRSHPEVAFALVVGQARFQPAALIQLRGDRTLSKDDEKEMLHSLTPWIKKANDAAPGYGKLQQELIGFTKPEKPLLVTPKGTIKRAASARAFEHEIDQLYADAEVFATSISAVRLDARDLPALENAILESLIAILGLQDLKSDQDVFAVGMDSLHVMNLVRQLKASFSGEEGGIAAHLITPKLIYSNPSATKLAHALHGLAAQGEDADEALEKERIKAMEDTLARYSKDLPEAPANDKVTKDDSITVVLTGSTGSLGSYMLDALLASAKVSKIICLNRGVHGEEKQKSVNTSRGLITEWKGKVQFLRTNLGKPKLGLSEHDYDMLVRKASFIIHNQWQVDFNLSLESFEPHIAGVSDLIKISNQSPNKPPILFTSSIATVGNWSFKHSGEKVPEHAFHDFAIPSAMGYGESKYVSERLLELAKEQSGVPAAIVRVGQLAGPVTKNGVWSKQEWLPSIIASSKYLSKVPNSLPGQDTISWVPVDLAARIIIELILADISSPPSSTAWLKHYNLVNPHHGDWSSIIPAITRYFAPASEIQPVSFEDWLEALSATAGRTEDANKNPAIKLLEFYEAMSHDTSESELETEKTAASSESMQSLRAVGPEWIEIWLKQWNF